jgi:hypothetical protein
VEVAAEMTWTFKMRHMRPTARTGSAEKVAANNAGASSFVA